MSDNRAVAGSGGARASSGLLPPMRGWGRNLASSPATEEEEEAEEEESLWQNVIAGVGFLVFLFVVG